MRTDPTKTPKEPTYQVVLDALALSPLYPAFLITAEVPEIYMHQFWHTITKIKNSPSYKFNLDKKKCTIDVEELGYTGDIDSVSKVYTDHMHQPWRTFALVINKCLSGKTTSLDKIRLSRAQILWGMYYNKNVDFVKLMFQIDNRDSKKQEKMYYPRFTKVIIQHFISKDKSISMRNKLFMHTVQHDSILGSLRFVSKTKEYQVYRALVFAKMKNRKMRNSTTYKTYLSFATGAATPKKARKFKKHASPSKKKALVAVEEPTEKPVKKPDARRQSTVALLEEAQFKKAIKQSKWETNIHQVGGSSEGADLQSEQSDDERTKSDDDKSVDLNKTDDDKEHKMHEEVSQKVIGDQVKDDAQVTVTVALVTQNTEVLLQSSSISSDYATKFLNFDNIPSATTSTTTILDSTTLYAIHQRLSDLENEVKTLKNVDHSSVLLAMIKSKVLNVVKEYLGTSLDHALYKHKALYHALMESILKDEDAIDKGFAEKSKKRKPDDADKDEAPPVRPDYGVEKVESAQAEETVSYVELDYNMEECYKVLNDQLDWNNPEDDRYPFDLSKPLPLIQSRNRHVVPVDYFFNNDLAYLQGESTGRTYMTSLTKTKAAKYDLPGIEDMVPNLWSPIKVSYDKHALLGTSYWDPKDKDSTDMLPRGCPDMMCTPPKEFLK
ncbi:hypothetical protein Tco_1171748 [Tanacetum coccineum]